jgi:aspartate dehydrogenase
VKKGTVRRRLGIVGCGAIGSLVARLLQKKKTSFQVTAVLDAVPETAERLVRRLKSQPTACQSLSQLISKCDLVLEAASVMAAPQVAEACLKRRKPVILMSTGGFLLHQRRLTLLAQKFQTKIYLPSGALCGLDGIRAARQIGSFRKIELTSTKPPKGLMGAPGLTSAQKHTLLKTKTPVYLYQGNVWGAIRSFPANVNVGATLAAASLAPQKLKVRIVGDPKIRFNQHEVKASGEFGELTTITRNRPSAENPKTSALAIQAVLALLERLESYVEVGN